MEYHAFAASQNNCDFVWFHIQSMRPSVTHLKPHLCFSRGTAGSTQQASVSEPLPGLEEGERDGEDFRIFWVQLFCLRCWCGCDWACLVSVWWGVSSLAEGERSGPSNCAGVGETDCQWGAVSIYPNSFLLAPQSWLATSKYLITQLCATLRLVCYY